MTNRDLIAALSVLPQDATVDLYIRDPRDTAYTDEILSVGTEKGPNPNTVRIVGWVASDNEDACAPWSCDRVDDDDSDTPWGRAKAAATEKID